LLAAVGIAFADDAATALPGSGFEVAVTTGFNWTVGVLGGAGGFPVDFADAGRAFAATAGVDGLPGSDPLLALGAAGCCFGAVAACGLAASAGADDCVGVAAGCGFAAAGAAACFAAAAAGSGFAAAAADGFSAAAAGCCFAVAGAACCFDAGAGCCFGAGVGCCFAEPGAAGFGAGSCPANNGVAVVSSTTTVANTLRLITASTWGYRPDRDGKGRSTAARVAKDSNCTEKRGKASSDVIVATTSERRPLD
jgi:hypothetical protein